MRFPYLAKRQQAAQVAWRDWPGARAAERSFLSGRSAEEDEVKLFLVQFVPQAAARVDVAAELIGDPSFEDPMQYGNIYSAAEAATVRKLVRNPARPRLVHRRALESANSGIPSRPSRHAGPDSAGTTQARKTPAERGPEEKIQSART